MGLRNYDRLMAVTWLTQDAQRDDQNQLILDAKGEPQFERPRRILRSQPEYKGYSELSTYTFGDSRVVLLAKDPLFVITSYSIHYTKLYDSPSSKTEFR